MADGFVLSKVVFVRDHGVRRRAYCSRMPLRARGDMEDSKLNEELNRRVQELFGDEGARGGEKEGGARLAGNRQSTPEPSYTFEAGKPKNDNRDAVFTLSSIAVMSVIAGILFTYLVNSGYVHDGSVQTKYYDMPTYGTASYIEPFEMLTREFQNLGQDVKADQPPAN